MGNKLESPEAEALQLTAGERATFAQLLLASLDEDAEIEEAWAAETERRIADIASGAVQAIPIADALTLLYRYVNRGSSSRESISSCRHRFPRPLNAPALKLFDPRLLTD